MERQLRDLLKDLLLGHIERQRGPFPTSPDALILVDMQDHAQGTGFWVHLEGQPLLSVTITEMAVLDD